MLPLARQQLNAFRLLALELDGLADVFLFDKDCPLLLLEKHNAAVEVRNFTSTSSQVWRYARMRISGLIRKHLFPKKCSPL